jgi:hypothetical protein
MFKVLGLIPSTAKVTEEEHRRGPIFRNTPDTHLPVFRKKRKGRKGRG